MIGALAFTTPLLLVALIALPILWWLLRAVPPAPIRRRFPGIALLFGLLDDENQTDKTPWWLLLLRMLALAAAIIGFAGPVLNPDERVAGRGNLLVLMDGSWASARDWPARLDRIEAVVADAGRDGRPVAVAFLTDLPPEGPVFQTADTVASAISGATPKPWAPGDMTAWIETLDGQSFETIWMSDGLDRPGRDELTSALTDAGPVTVIEGQRPVFALAPARFEDGDIVMEAHRQQAADARQVTVVALGPDPNGSEQVLAREIMEFEAGESTAEIALSLPTELRNRVRRFELEGVRSAGAVSLTDDALKRREIALLAGREDTEATDLLSPLYYLNRALVPTADLIEAPLDDALLASPDAIVFADIATLSDAEAERLTEWVENGGMLVRFAGPRTAAAEFERDDPLLPVRLRAGGRSVGGAMSWGEPKSLRAFTQDSPFFGLPIPEDVEVISQVVAEPDPTLAERTIATLADGTPLVTRSSLGEGQVILFHVTANAEWSTLPLSGLFVQMLERLAISTRPTQLSEEELAGTVWTAEDVLDAFGTVRRADTLPGVPGEQIASRALGPLMPPGLYAGGERRVALNVFGPDDTLTPAVWPDSVTAEGMTVTEPTPLMGALLSLALALLLIDAIASLWLAGRLRPMRGAVVAVALISFTLPFEGHAQDEATAVEATSEVVLAYVETGDPQLDQVSREGLSGLSQHLYRRTSVEPAEPFGVDLETDELSFFPLLYWPVSERQPTPSSDAYAKLNRYLRTGGMIVFDTRDGNVAGFGSSTPTGRKLQQLARPLDIPALEPVPSDHVLTRTFYLLQDFPGRHAGRDVWVEAAPADAEQVEGLPFRNLNDGVTPVLIGGNDWASAWALDARGRPLYRVGRGFGGERQRELSIRFGINLVMHVLTGNYKSDQVHVPALLDRLGN